ncbi:Putative esterase, FIGfam005057 [plant metagenome]|uniref:Esterase, FIGfam005057 n=1 Tax=plant metagenome TaxID=1297885 RepID=A0A484Q552_9ZZZZ
MLLYLHGFRSSPQSYKAQLTAKTLSALGMQRWWRCPQLPVSPREAAQLALAEAESLLAGPRWPGCPDGPDGLTVVGSSLGGYYATWLAERLGCRAVLLNPAVLAARALAAQVGEHQMYHSDAPMTFLPDYLDELDALHVPRLTRPERYFLIAATGDEVLDWRDMRDYAAGCRQHIIEGGDHALSGFERWLPLVLAFANLPAPPSPASP